MKKLFAVLAFLAAAAPAFAQTINFGIVAGLNMADQIHVNSRNYGSSLHAGIKAGGILDVGFQNFSIEPGLFFSQKGENDQSRYLNLNPFDGGGAAASKTTLSYIGVPVNFLYKAKIAPGTNLHFGGGPYVAYLVSEDVSLNGQSSSRSGDFKKSDYGIGIVAGATITKLRIDAGYELGVPNIDLTGASAHNSVISLSLGYLF